MELLDRAIGLACCPPLLAARHLARVAPVDDLVDGSIRSVFREFERSMVTALNAYVQPTAMRYLDSLERDLRQRPADIAAVVTPAEAAQRVADRLVTGGVAAILNFAPVQLVVPATVTVKTVNLVLELETLSYALNARGER